jgi:mRNA-degrading endonuclease RelE of RelBE toxin-antitoxin system
MKFYCTASFAQDLKKLRKKPHQYGSVFEDIGSEFAAIREGEDVQKLGDSLFEDADSVILKVRTCNSTMKKGQRGGFRILVILLLANDECVFLHVYPKLGAAAKPDISTKELVSLMRDFREDYADGHLLEVSFQPQLVIGEANEGIGVDFG